MNGVVPYSMGITSATLSMLLCEVEAQVNNRPLTKVSEDPNDVAVLTPSHLLLLRGNTNYTYPTNNNTNCSDTVSLLFTHY